MTEEEFRLHQYVMMQNISSLYPKKPQLTNEQIQTGFRNIFTLLTPRQQMIKTHNELASGKWLANVKIEE